MSGIETIEGKCPNCEKQMYQKLETSGYGFVFDACACCGYIQATVDSYEINCISAWANILEARGNGERTIREFSEQQGWLHKECRPDCFVIGGLPIIEAPDNIQDYIIDRDIDIFKVADALPYPLKDTHEAPPPLVSDQDSNTDTNNDADDTCPF